MTEHDALARQIETSRNHLRAVAYRMLGSTTEADALLADSVGMALVVVLADDGRIAAMDVVGDPAAIERLALASLTDSSDD